MMKNPKTQNQSIEIDSTEIAILETLINTDDYISGSVLAKSIGISRTTIHTKIDQLKSAGFKINAISNRGYCLEKLPKKLTPQLLFTYGKQLTKDFQLFFYPSIDSTNFEAERLFSNGAKPPFAVFTNKQTAGKGRLGRKWHSQANQNLYCSIMFSPNTQPEKLQSFTLWAGIEVCRSIKALIPTLDLKIKWPNDLYCNGKKVSGILTEARIDSDRMHTIILGLGLNINSTTKSFPEEIRSIATSLRAETNQSYDMNALSIEIIQATVRAYKKCTVSNNNESLSKAWDAFDYLKDKPISLTENGQKVSGLALGINSYGALQIKKNDGKIHTIHSGDVTLKQ
ncbi:MAG: biotin--[acetyl-CoA-carboxylase] ligase [Puniceicoccaceae bacterium MED-G32]|jgi:BirA family biotin operon repressor/biotin-[acetyl-CoA-carboxylase] ligase|nr:MAG: biotin--[acetyl-CoA-carboxylase] ligase [Puniceicoccaceae bacterium MED-G32]